ncbi:hypothetical protein H8356DRAFT_1617343 [Neocallimastix lanati (nom. inval.)]|nr:hypothetical protein H8356DRAFT_1617343 [Neocallimastix sp. JGI-2020a]
MSITFIIICMGINLSISITIGGITIRTIYSNIIWKKSRRIFYIIFHISIFISQICIYH